MLLERMLGLARQSEQTIVKLLEQEQVSKTDLLLLRLERRKAETALQGAEIALLGQRRQLAASMGVSIQFITEVEGDLATAVTPFDDEEVLMQVITSSPVVQIANLDVNRTILLLRRAEVEVIPNVSLQGGTQYSESTANYQALLGVYLNVPLWNKNQGNIMAANASVRRATANRQAVQQELTKQLADAVMRYRVSEQAVKNYQEGILPDAVETLKLVNEGFKQGQIEILRLLQTQRAVFEANIDYIAALENRLNSAAEIAGLLQLDQFP